MLRFAPSEIDAGGPGRTRSADIADTMGCIGLEATTLAVAILIGVYVGRWWVIVLALPAGLLASARYSFEGFSGGEVAVLFGIAVAFGLTLGVIARKSIGR